MSDSPNDVQDRAELKALRTERSLKAALAGNSDLINIDDICTLLNGSGEVKSNDLGQVDIGSVNQAVQRLLSAKPYLSRSSRQDHGITSQGVPAQIPSYESQARAIFGKGSDGGKANTLAKSNIAEYRRLRKIAVSLDLLSS